MTISFYNETVLPLECIQTFGVSVKENEHPIGYFGTGLKYAIAVLLVNDCKIRAYIDGKQYWFTKQIETVRGKDFEFIYMNDLKLPFTTELGKNWELWMAYRELWSNCQDESGTVYEEGCSTNDGTCIVVEGLDEVHAERHRFLCQTQPIAVMGDIEIHKSDEPAIFYKGIKVADIGSAYSYNLLCDIDLTEDRTASEYEVEMEIVGKLRKRTDSLNSFYSNQFPNFLGKISNGVLSNAVKNKIAKLKGLFGFEPVNIFVTVLENEDFRLIDGGICLSSEIMSDKKRLAFAYCLANLKREKKNAGRDNYKVIVENMLPYFNFEGGADGKGIGTKQQEGKEAQKV